MTLTIEEYTHRELRVDFSKSDAISPEIFKTFKGFLGSVLPRISNEQEMGRYVDHPSKNSFCEYFAERLGSATPEEFDNAQTLFAVALKFQDALGAGLSLPQYSLVDSLSMVRTLQNIYGVDARPRILELGGSSGIISAYAALLGFPSTILEMSQPHAILQSWFLAVLTAYRGITTPLKTFPWWEWMSGTGPLVDGTEVVVANSFLLKLPTEILLSVLDQIRGALQKRVRHAPGLLICYRTEEESFFPWRALWEKIQSAHFRLLHLDSHQAVFSSDDNIPDQRNLVRVLREKLYPDSLDRVVPAEHFETLLLALKGA